MDARQSFYLAPGRDDLAELPPGASRRVCDIPYVVAANDNLRVKERLQARCKALLRRLLALHRWPRQAAAGPSMTNWSDEETDDPHYADRRNFYKVEKWNRDGLRVELMLYAGNNLDKARRIFERTLNTDLASGSRYASACGCWRSGRTRRCSDAAVDCISPTRPRYCPRPNIK